METRRLGSLDVSVIGLGCNQLGTAACDEATAIAVINEALDNGVNYFDTSDEYGRNYADASDLSGWGRSEEILGKALRSRRDEVIIATKFGPIGDEAIGTGPGDPLWERSRASAHGIRVSIEESLQRLGTDRIDLYQIHFPDPLYPIAETLGALDELVKAGKVREIGCSNFSGEQLAEARSTALELGTSSFVSVQCELNVLRRGALETVMGECEASGVAFIPYYPLASGVLTGKYRRGEAPPAGARLTEQLPDSVRSRILSDRTFARIEALEAYAVERGHTLLELAFGWLLGHGPVASVIAGASKPGQVASNAAAANWRMTPDEVAAVTALVESLS
ncbi:MAG: aldo/keto reductase [Acidimicrobiia bacterium]